MVQAGTKHIFLADDDEDDCILFEDALREVADNTRLTMANDGIELMGILEEAVPPPPYVVFLDLNMPLKNGFECLAEIRATNKLKDIRVVIFSTSTEGEAINRTYEQGADYYICKPRTFSQLKKAIDKVLTIDWHEQGVQPSRDQYLLAF